MRYLGYVLITVSFLVCSYLTVLNEFAVNWVLFIPFLLVGVAGVAMARISTRREAESEDVVTKNIGSLRTSLENVVTNIRQLNEDKSNINVYDLPQQIDSIFLDDLNTFVDARESIGHAYTLQDYADIMSHYAAGERYLNRVWSAAADGYIDESHTYIGRAQTQFEEANERLKALQ
ncbi:MAG: hypothetical protein GF372_12680 [Candidatus Marinimicrobia bacterium]|nr:hypothetical protein [Candidatus Neomarinimicrobiota bacterium]